MSDYDIQYYSAAALSNLAVNPKHRAMMIAVGHSDVVRQLVKLLSSKKDRVNRHFMVNYWRDFFSSIDKHCGYR